MSDQFTSDEFRDKMLSFWPTIKGGNLAGVVTREEYWQRALELA